MRFGPGSNGTVMVQNVVPPASFHCPPLALQNTFATETLSVAFPPIVKSVLVVSAALAGVKTVIVGLAMSWNVAVKARPERIWNFKTRLKELVEPLQPSKR